MGVSIVLEVADDGSESLKLRPALELALGGPDETSWKSAFVWPLLASAVSIGAGRFARLTRDCCCLLRCSKDVASTPST